MVDAPRRVEERRPVGLREEARELREEVLPVHEEVQREREDHEDGKAGAREAADKLDHLVARGEEARRALRSVARRLDGLIGVQGVRGAGVLELVDIGGDLLLERLGAVLDRREQGDREKEDGAADDEERERRRHAAAEARRVKILISGSIEKARNPAATSHTIVSRTSQMPMRSAITPRTTATTSSVVVTKNRRLGRPVGMSGTSPIEAIAD